ncbi:MAG: twin-arginine translocase subunit TatC [Longimicrobiales bacterium]
MPFLDHLEELRWRVLWSLLALVLCSIVSFGLVYYFQALEILIAPIRAAYDDPDLQLIFLSPADPFFVTLRLAIYGGIILSFPILVYQIWSFLSPALEKDERRAIVPALYLLFIGGVCLAYFAALPVTLEFFKAFLSASLEGTLEINATLGFIVKMLIAFGAVFELPIVILALSLMGLVTPQFLRSKRRHAIVLITVLASFITPGDAITLTVMMMFPLILLYEFGIFLSAGVYRRRAKKEAQHETSLAPPDGSVGKD